MGKMPCRYDKLRQAIATCHRAHKARVGATSIHTDLVQAGYTGCIRTIGRYMRYLGLKAKGSRKFKCTTDSSHNKLVCANFLNRQFEVTAPNEVWVSDITYIRTQQGWLYLAVVIDLYSRAIVGWQVSERIDAALVCDTLHAALLVRGRPQGVMIHSDQGVQYASNS
jgi:putative transposase